MLANPHHSRLVLINPGRKEPIGTPTEFLARRHESLSLLRSGLGMFGLTADVAGEYQVEHIPAGLVQFLNAIDLDALSFWQELPFTQSVVAQDVAVVFLGGA
jgi:hypothetical protein